MNSNAYRQGIKNIQRLIISSLIRQTPTLDSVMGYDDMSETDKIFYNAYKKYGNRNHTWQDFKAMFNGDIQNMQENIKHWKTWDEINSLYSQLYKQRAKLNALLDKYEIQGITSRNISGLSKTHPDLIKEYEYLQTLKPDINYCTFDPVIGKLENEFKTKYTKILSGKAAVKKLAMEYINRMYNVTYLRNADFVTAERTEEYLEIILNNPKILSLIKRFYFISNTEKINLARLILDESAKKHGTPIARVVQDDAIDGPHILKRNQIGGYNPYKQVFLFRADIGNFLTTHGFLKLLAHEDAHRVDFYNPEHGMIGTQLMDWCSKNYYTDTSIGEKMYEKQATELSSYYLERPVADALDYTLRHQR